jgi:hypothetical protein
VHGLPMKGRAASTANRRMVREVSAVKNLGTSSIIMPRVREVKNDKFVLTRQELQASGTRYGDYGDSQTHWGLCPRVTAKPQGLLP